ncbi:MAG: hypothetical protein EYC70_02385 [Planctomycetota bacterium]|nr:MAG: hypothetical protein EYC70_02385 [Planctomycetota bacterium]
MLAPAAASAQGPGLSAVKYVGGDEAPQLATNSQYAPAIAAGSSGYLAAWTDGRSQAGATGSDQGGYDVLAARLDPAGNPLGQGVFVLSASHGYQRNPQVVWNGQSWLVAWENQSLTASYYESRIVGVRVAENGEIQDAQPIDFGAGSMFTVASNGSTWLVVLESASAGQGGLWGYRLAGDGTELDPGGVLLVPETYYLLFNPRAAAAGGEYLLAWEDLNGPLAQRFDAGLQPIGARFAVASTRFASSGGEYLFVHYAQATNSLRATRMSASGVVLDPNGIALADQNAAWLSAFDGAWDGSQWWASWIDPVDGVNLCRVLDGVALDFNGFAADPAPDDPRGARLAAAPGGAEVVWQERPAQGFDGEDILGVHATAAGQAGPRVDVSTGAPAQNGADFAVGPEGYWIAWRESVSGVNKAMVARLDGFGNATGAPIEVGTGLNGSFSGPALAWNGTYFLVVWGTSTGVVGRRLRADGSFADLAPFPIMPGSWPDVEALGDVFLVADIHFYYWEFRSVYAARVDGSTGAVLDTPAFEIGTPFAQPPRVSTFAGRWLVTYQQNWSHDSTLASAVAVTVNPDGTRGASTGLGTICYTPDVAASDRTALFVYRSGSPSTPYADIVARLLLADGTLLPQFTIAGGTYKELEPAVTWNGNEFVVAWEDLRDQVGFYDGRTDLYGMRVREDGTLLDPAGGFLLEAEGYPVAQAALASFEGRTLLAASFFRAPAPYANWRLGTRTIGAWSDLGNALAGSAGAPVLDAHGELVAGQTLTWAVSHAHGNSAGAFVIGRSRADQPLYGGILVPQAEKLVSFVTSADGSVERSIPVTRTLPPGTPVFLQAWLLDPTGPQAHAASNALAGVAP